MRHDLRSAVLGACENCGKRPATAKWTGETSTLEVVRGAGVAHWCAICCTEAQIVHCRKVAAKIPDLEAELRDLRGQANRTEGSDGND